MTPEQMAKELGGYGGDAILVQIEQHESPALVRAIRKSFEKGNEQGNARRLDALVILEGEGAIDVLCAVLEDTVEVGGIYSNLRNTALELIQAQFLGHPKLEASLWKAIEIDKYLDIDRLYTVMRPYDPARAAALVIPSARQGVPAAIGALAAEPSLRATLLELLPDALASESSEYVIHALGGAASEPDVGAILAPHADTNPAIAELGIATADLARLRSLAARLDAKDVRWQAVAIRALARLDPAEAFDRASGVFTSPTHTKPAGRYRANSVVEAMDQFAHPLDVRWLPFVLERLAAEDHKEFRGILVLALGKLGPDAAPAIIDAPRDEKDAHVLAAMSDALGMLGPNDDVLALVRIAQKTAKPKKKRALGIAIELLEDS